MVSSEGWILASLAVGSIGVGLFVYGRKQSRAPQLACGLVMIGESICVTSAGWMLAIAAATLALLVLAVRADL